MISSTQVAPLDIVDDVGVSLKPHGWDGHVDGYPHRLRVGQGVCGVAGVPLH